MSDNTTQSTTQQKVCATPITAKIELECITSSSVRVVASPTSTPTSSMPKAIYSDPKSFESHVIKATIAPVSTPNLVL